MRPQQKRLAIVVGLAVLGAGTYLLREKAPQSLAEAFELRRQDLAGAYDVLLPVGAGTRLGTRAHSKDPDTGRVTLDLNPCFFLPPPVQRASLSELVVEYQSAHSIAAEFEKLLSGGAHASDGATLSLRDLRVVSGLGVINPNGACNGEGEYAIVTQELVAGTAELSAGGELVLGAKGSAISDQHSQARTGWSQSGTSSITGADIVLGGVLQRVSVKTLAEEHVWIDPPIRSGVSLPSGITGTLQIEDYSAGNWLKITVTAPGNVNVVPPDRFEICSVGTVQQLPLPGTCYYLVSANVLLSVSVSFDSEHRLILKMIGYRTEYADHPV